jgi:hypothetical protein
VPRVLLMPAILWAMARVTAARALSLARTVAWRFGLGPFRRVDGLATIEDCMAVIHARYARWPKPWERPL